MKQSPSRLTPIFQTDIGDLNIQLLHRPGHPESFVLAYGKELDANMPRKRAATKLGEAILHALETEGNDL